MVNNSRVYFWFAIQFSIASAGAFSALVDVWLGIAVFIIALLCSAITLNLGWSSRKEKDFHKKTSEFIAAIGLMGFVFCIFLVDLLLALGVLVFFAQLAINVVLREYRQLYFGFVIAFVLVFLGAAESLLSFYILILILYVLASSFCLAESWLDNRNVVSAQLKTPSNWRRVTVSVTIILVASIMYLLFPRPPALLLGARESKAADFYVDKSWENSARNPDKSVEQNTHTDNGARHNESENGSDSVLNDTSSYSRKDGFNYRGFSEQFEINETGQMDPQSANTIVAYMQAAHSSYLKVRVFDIFDGKSWATSTQDHQKLLVKWGEVVFQEDQKANFVQVIDIQQNMSAWVPASPQIVSMTLPASVIALDSWRLPMLPRDLSKGTVYTVNSKVEFVDNRLIGGGPTPSAGDLQIPHDIDPRIKVLTEAVTQGASTDLQKSILLEEHLRSQYSYSFQSIFSSQGVTPLDVFLFDTKEGHCEYFASAMAIMLRTIGIPSRLVTGFSATNLNPLTGYYEIRALDGHAWVEAWVDDSWMTFEPTAMYQLPSPNNGSISAAQINDYVENLTRTEEAIGEGVINVKTLILAAWAALYYGAIVLLSIIKLALVILFPYLAGLVVLISVLYFTREWWFPILYLVWSHIRIKLHKPKETKAAVNFYLYYLQVIYKIKNNPRQKSQLIEEWTDELGKVYKSPERFKLLSTMVNQIFYESVDINIKQIREIAIKALPYS